MSTNYSKKIPADLVTPSEAAKIRGISRQAVSKLIKRGRLTVYSLGGRSFVRKSEIEKFKPMQAGRPKVSD